MQINYDREKKSIMSHHIDYISIHK